MPHSPGNKVSYGRIEGVIDGGLLGKMLRGGWICWIWSGGETKSSNEIGATMKKQIIWSKLFAKYFCEATKMHHAALWSAPSNEMNSERAKLKV